VTKKKPSKAEEETKKKGDVIDRLINATKSDPSYKTVVRCLQIVKNVFGATKHDMQELDYPDEDKKGREKADVNSQAFSKALGSSEEYVKLL